MRASFLFSVPFLIVTCVPAMLFAQASGPPASEAAEASAEVDSAAPARGSSNAQQPRRRGGAGRAGIEAAAVNDMVMGASKHRHEGRPFTVEVILLSRTDEGDTTRQTLARTVSAWEPNKGANKATGLLPFSNVKAKDEIDVVDYFSATTSVGSDFTMQMGGRFPNVTGSMMAGGRAIQNQYKFENVGTMVRVKSKAAGNSAIVLGISFEKSYLEDLPKVETADSDTKEEHAEATDTASASAAAVDEEEASNRSARLSRTTRGGYGGFSAPGAGATAMRTPAHLPRAIKTISAQSEITVTLGQSVVLGGSRETGADGKVTEYCILLNVSP